MNDLAGKLKQVIIRLSKNEKFIHHSWFVKYHLEIVERISLELCNTYKEADRNLVCTMVWMHDYGKLLDFDNQHETTQKEGKKLLLELGFGNEFVVKVFEYIKIMDDKLKLDLSNSPLEVKIVSSADGAAHLVGPFFSVYFQENHSLTLEALMVGNIRKAMKDWGRKIVLPEVKKSFEARYKMVLEQNGQIPDTFLG